MSDEPNTRFSGMKQDIQDTTSEFAQSLAARLKGWEIQNINSQLVDIKYDLTKNMKDIVNDSLSKVKYIIIEGLREQNLLTRNWLQETGSV